MPETLENALKLLEAQNIKLKLGIDDDDDDDESLFYMVLDKVADGLLEKSDEWSTWTIGEIRDEFEWKMKAVSSVNQIVMYLALLGMN